VCYVVFVTQYTDTRFYDNGWYNLQAYGLAHGAFFSIIFGTGPDASHPPLTSIAITPVSYFFGLHPGQLPQRFTMVVLGTLVVLFVGLLARRLVGPRTGLVAAAIAALYPNMWIPNGIVMSETLTMLGMTLALLAAYRLMRSPSWPNAALLGLACGIEMLVRAELVLLVPMLLLPAVLACRNRTWRVRFAFAGVGMIAAGLTVGPWVGRNLASFKDPTYLSTGEGPVLLGANCPQTYYGPGLGSWSFPCSLDVPKAHDQSVESTLQFDAGKRYMEHHLSRVPVVVLARVGRVWDFYEPLQMVDVDVHEGRPIPASFAGLLAYYALLPAAVVGVVEMRRRRITQWPLLMTAALVTVVAAAGFGMVRFRAEAEVPLVVLAAVGVSALSSRLARRRERPTATASADEGPDVLHELVLDLEVPSRLGHVDHEEQV
jgi:4-amino-4-deoxy-L-arabinose transferase-like glycosyltransferase